MSDHFINLNCANCGAKLEVYDDMERFACGHCGTQMIAQRRGGTVTLKAVTEAIQKVQIGTDKTAAELALIRLGKEWAWLYEDLKRLTLLADDIRTKSSNRKGISAVFGLVAALMGASLLIVGLLAAYGEATFFGLLILGGTLTWTYKSLTRSIANELAPIEKQMQERQTQIDKVMGQIAEQRLIVDSPV
jgi:ribosomal protein S27E